MKCVADGGKLKSLLFLPFVLGVLTLAMSTTGTANAESNLTNVHMDRSNTFYAYVQAGESLDASIIKFHDYANTEDATLVVSGPNGVSQNCQVSGTAPASPNPAGSCSLAGLTSTESGVWQMQFQYAGGANHDLYGWEFIVKDGVATPIPGRVWMEEYSIFQASNQAADTDMTLWFQSEFGYQYRARYLTFNGIDSTIYANNVGLVHAADPSACLPLYKSVDLLDASYAVAPDSCHSKYKLFFDAPDAALPAAATRWDGSAEWILPPISTPAITSLTFASSTAGARSGNITFDLANFVGPLSVRVDANNNGSFNDPEDVTLPYTATSTGAQSIPFNGLDGLGNAIPATQAIGFRVAIDRVAEIHFIGLDIEQWSGGIEVIRQNGPSGNEDVIYWDDTGFADPDANRCPTPLNVVPDGTAGVASTGGTHAWTNIGCAQFGNYNNGINGSWGDHRYINNWTFVPAEVVSTYVLPAHTAETGALANTGTNMAIPVLVAVALIFLSAVVIRNNRQSGPRPAPF